MLRYLTTTWATRITYACAQGPPLPHPSSPFSYVDDKGEEEKEKQVQEMPSFLPERATLLASFDTE